MSPSTILGIDVGGSSIKAALVAEDGAIRSNRLEVSTPQPATPRAVGQALLALSESFEAEGRIGIAFPAPIIDSNVRGPANVADDWIGMAGGAYLEAVLGRPVVLLNDADAAGLAEASLGAARGIAGLVLLLTLGTGIGSAMINDGHLIRNTELGLTPFGDYDVEQYAAPSVMRLEGIDEREWADRFSEVIALFESLFHPDLIVVSGGITKRWLDLSDLVESQVPLAPARFESDAGIIGASIAALRQRADA